MIDDDLPLGVRARYRLARMFENRVAAHLPDRHLRIPGPDGKIYLNLRESGMTVNRAFRVYEYWMMSFVRSLLEPGMTAIDVGANQGDYTLRFAHLVKDGGRVLAFEPDPENCHWLQKSIEANDYRWVEVHQIALSEREGSATFYPGGKSGWGSLKPGSRNAKKRPPFDVRTRRLDDVLSDLAIGNVDLIKVDVEGSELGVLKGCQSLLSDSKNVTLVLDVDAETEDDERQEIYEFLNSTCGLQVWKLGKTIESSRNLEAAGAVVASKRPNMSR